MGVKANKITVVGTGVIGSTVAYTLMVKGLAKKIVLVNRNTIKASTKAMDLSHCTPLFEEINVISGDFEDSLNSEIIIVAAGELPDENGTRMDVMEKNLKIYKSIIPEIAKYSPNAIMITVTNPMDVMTYAAYRISGFHPGRVIGSGTLLDTIRFRYFIGRQLNIDPGLIQADVIGEHGQTMVPVWSRVAVSGVPLAEYLELNKITLNKDFEERIEHLTKRAGWEIRLGNEHSCYGISLSVVKIVENILGFDGSPVPVSLLLSGEYNLKGVFMSLPAWLSCEGVNSINYVELNQQEYEKLYKSADELTGFIKRADKYL